MMLDRKKETSVYVRVSAEEKEIFTAAAEKERMTFSEWARWAMRRAVEQRAEKKIERGTSK